MRGHRDLEHQLVVCVLGLTKITNQSEGVDGDDIALSAIQRKIVARLALHHGHSVGIRELADAIWDESQPATAQTSIHNQISRIRSRLGPDAIETNAGRYTLRLPTDVEVVTSLLTQGEQALSRSRLALVGERTNATLRWWRGLPFADLDSTHEVIAERQRLAEVYRSLETMFLEGAIDNGQLAWAIPEAERLVAQAPDDEHRWVLLMHALERAGRRGDALGAYERARRSLAERLGLEPSTALRAAEAAVLHDHEPTHTRRSTSLVGREQLITNALTLCDTGAAVVLVGEPGSGKSRVLAEIQRRLRGPRLTVAAANSTRYTDTAISTLRTLAEELGTPLDGRQAPVDAFVAAIRRAVDSRGPVALTVDDLDREGPTTIEALRAATKLSGVALVATASDAPSLATTLEAALLTIDPLGHDGLAELAAEFVPKGTHLDQNHLNWLIEMSGGNPGFLELLVEDPLWLNRDGPSPSSEHPLQSPDLRDVVHLRLKRLGFTTQEALEVAAVCGSSCPAAVITELGDADGIAAGIGASLLTTIESDDGERWIRFRHGAVQRILYEDMAPGRRMEIHYRVARHLRSTGAPILLVATHSSAAVEVDPTAASGDALAAAVALGEAGAHAESALWFERTLDALDRVETDEPTRVAALIGYGDALRLAGSPDQDKALFTAAEAAFALGDQDLIARATFAVLQLGTTTESGRVHTRAIDLAERALIAVDDPDSRALIAGGASLAHSMSDNSDRCRGLFLQAEAEAKSPDIRRYILPFAYLGIGHPSDLELRRRITAELLTLSNEADDPIARFEGLQLAFSVALQVCDGAWARKTVEASSRLIDQVGDVGRRWSLSYQRAAVAFLDDDLDQAEVHTERALEMFSTVSPSRAFAAYGGQLLVIRMAQGRIGELADTIEALLTDQPGVPAWNAAFALTLTAVDPDRAAHHAAAALDDVAEDFTWLASHVIGGRAAAGIGDPAIVARYIECLTPHSGLGCWQGTCSYGPVDTVLWLLHDTLGHRDAARHHLKLARVSADRLQAPVFQAELMTSAR